MNARINPPHAQPGPAVFSIICVLGVVAAVRGMTSLPLGSEQWWVGFLGLAVLIPAFAFIIGGWLHVQREVAFESDAIRVRRWREILAGRPGRVMPLDAGTRAAITLENIRSLRLEHEGVAPIGLTLGYWELRSIRQLVEVLRGRGIPLAQYWAGVYPPGTE